MNVLRQIAGEKTLSEAEWDALWVELVDERGREWSR